MSEFKGFSEAARLFAANLNIVNAMKELFEQELVKYLDALANSIRKSLEAGYFFNDDVTSGYRYWWIAEKEESRDKQLRAWFPAKPPEVLTDNKLVLHVYTPDPTPAKLAMVKQLLEVAELADRPGRDRWSIIDADIKCEAADLIDGPSGKITNLLQELRRIEIESSSL